MRVVFFSVLTKRICMHETKFLMNIFKYCFKNYIKWHEFANCTSANYDVQFLNNHDENCYPVNKFDNVATTSGNFEEIKYFRHATS